MLHPLSKFLYQVTFYYFKVVEWSFFMWILEHADPLAKKRGFWVIILEHVDPLNVSLVSFVSKGFLSMLTPWFVDFFYLYLQVRIKIEGTMAGKPSNMSVIKEVLRQYFVCNTPKKQIASHLGISKNTVKKYIHLAQEDTLEYAELITLDDPILENRLLAGSPAYTDGKYHDFKTEIDYYVGEFAHKHVTLKVLWEEYIGRHPNGYSYSQFCHHISQAREKKPSVVTILTDKFIPGEKLFVDFAGDPMYYVDHSTGEMIKCQIFIACLPYSDFTFAMAVPSQCQEDFMYALIQCFNALGGVPQILVTDNLKAAVIKASYRHSPTLNALMAQVGLHYNCTVIPTKPYSPTHKAKVEGQVRIIYNRVYAKLRKQTFFSIHELNRAIAEKVLAHNQTRMRDKGYTREEQFLSKESRCLLPLPDKDFDIKYTARLKVQNNCCVKLARDSHYYSVPFQYVGQQVIVEYTRTLVKIFLKGKGTLLATHPRDMCKGGYTVCDEHLASNSLAMINRTSATYIERAYKRSPLLGDLIDKMFKQPSTPAEFWYKRCEELLHMEKSNVTAYNFAMKVACEHEIYSPKRIKAIYANATAAQEVLYDYEDDNLVPTTRENLRGQSYYTKL